MIYSAFVLGLLGSVHCVGMCGPIALALSRHKSRQHLVFERLSYHLGRAVTYAALGTVAGLMGQSLIYVIGYQIYISVLLGVFLILTGLLAANPEQFIARLPLVGGIFGQLRGWMAGYLQGGQGLSRHFSLGLLNGFLPCGLVYLGLTGAMATGQALSGTAYMFAFGMGTLPLMLAVTLLGKYMGDGMKDFVRRLYPVLFIALGIFLIIRGIQTDLRLPASGQEVMCH